MARSAVELVVTRAAVEAVIAVLAPEPVVAGPAIELVMAVLAPEPVMTATAPLDLVHRPHRTHDRRLSPEAHDRRLLDRRLLDRRLLDRRLLDRRLLDRRFLDRRLLDWRFFDRGLLLGRALANDRGFRARVGDLMVAAGQRGDAMLDVSWW